VANATTAGTPEDQALSGVLTGSDIDGSALRYAVADAPLHGEVVVTADTGAYRYLPDANFNGTDSFTFIVNDGTADSVAAGVSITVSAVNDEPAGELSIEGVAKIGQRLWVTHTLTDADGLTASGPDDGLVYQWYAGAQALADGTGSSLTVLDSLAGQDITVRLSYVDAQGTAEHLSSQAVSVPPSKTLDFWVYSWRGHDLLEGVSLSSGARGADTDLAGRAQFGAVNDDGLTISAARVMTQAQLDDAASAVNLQDAIAILKMVVGLNVNAADQRPSPYQALAADFDGNGAVELNDAIGVLKHVVGLTGAGTPEPVWRLVDETSPQVAGIAADVLHPGQPPAITLDLTAVVARVHVGLTGYLRGDVDDSFSSQIQGASVETTSPDYFETLVADHPELDLAQFGIYG